MGATTAELTVVLKADGSGLTGTVRVSADEVRKLGNVLDEAGRKASDAGKKIDAAGKTSEAAMIKAGAGAAALLAGFALLVKQQVDYAAGLDTVAKRTGIAVEQLSALNAAAKRNDASAKDVTSGIDALGDAMVRASLKAGAGGKQTSAAFAAIGVSVKDAHGQLRPTVDVLQDVAAGLAKLPDGALKSELATKLLGASGKDLQATLDELAHGGMQGLIDKAHETGEVISTQAAANAKKFKDDVQALQTQVTTFAQGVAQDALPTLLALAGVMLDTGTAADTAGNKSTLLRGFIEGLGESVIVITETFRVLFTMLYGGIDILVAVGEAAVRTTASIGLATASAGAFATGNLEAAGKFANEAKSQFVTGWNDVREAGTRAWGAIEAAGDDADKKIADYQRRLEQAHTAASSSSPGTGQFSNVAGGSRSVDGQVANKADAAAEALKRYQDALRNNSTAERQAVQDNNILVKVLADAAKGLQKADDLASQLADGLDGPYAQAQAHYLAGIKVLSQGFVDLNTQRNLGVISQEEYEAGTRRLSNATAQLGEDLENQNQKIRAQHNAMAQVKLDLQQQLQLLGTEPAKRQAATQAFNAYNNALKSHFDLQGNYVKNEEDLKAALDAQLPSYTENIQLANDLNAALQFEEAPTQLQQLTSLIDRLGEEMRKSLDPDVVAKLQGAIDGLTTKKIGMELEQGANAVAESLRSLQSLSKEGSKEYQAMAIAIKAANIAAGIGAILNQGMGDPYTAIPRMVAMAAMVASLIGDIKSFTGGGSNPAHSADFRQEHQGTGTVLGDADAKSESIAKAVEITANATSQLVGLNRGMLDALRALQGALGAAGNQLARGAGNAAFPGTHDATYGLMGPLGQYNPLLNAMTGGNDPIGNAIGGFLWGGSQKVIDQGIQIAGGRLSDMLNSIVVGAYQTIETSGGLFGNDTTSDQFGAVSDEFTKQFQLVIGSIVDTVRAGATALGLLPADIEAAIAEYQVAETKISLKGLSAEDQQKELEAVFSSIFDGLAGAVVPFIGQFQKVGEGLGETLVRIATEVQVVQEGFKQLGKSIDETDPERFAQISDELITAAGGIDAFISGMQSFVSNFSNDAHQLDVSSAALTSAFAQAGLTVPKTRDEMWALMQSLDATTEQGREQIATLLRLSDVSKAYYDQLDKAAAVLGLNQTSDTNAQLKAIRDSATGLADAMRRAGASSAELQRVYDAAVDKMNELIDQLQASAQSAAFDLGITTVGSLDQVNAEIARLQNLSQQSSSSVRGFGSAMESASEQAKKAIDLLLSDLSPLNDQEKLQAALGGLRAGTVSQEQVLEIGRRLYASSQAYKDLFAQVQSIGDHTGGNGAHAGGGRDREEFTPADQARLTQLLAEQQRLQETNRLEQFQNLAKQIAQIMDLRGESLEQVLERMSIKPEDLAQGLGLPDASALGAYFDNIKDQTDAAGENTASIVAAIIHLGDRITGVIEPVTAANQEESNRIRNGRNGDDATAPGNLAPSLPPGTGRTGDADGADGGYRGAPPPGVPGTRPGYENAGPQGAVPPPPGSGPAPAKSAGAPETAGQIEAIAAQMRAVQDTLAQILEAQRKGTGEIVEAIAETTGAVDTVDQSVRTTRLGRP